MTDFPLGRIVTIIILTGEQAAHQEDGRIDARKLDIAEPGAGFHVEEMIEETLVAAGSFGPGP